MDDEDSDFVVCCVCGKDLDLREPHITLIENFEVMSNGGIDVLGTIVLAYKHKECAGVEGLLENSVVNVPPMGEDARVEREFRK